MTALHFLAAGGGGFNPMTFDPAAAALTILTFLLLVFLLGKYAWKPILEAVEAREERIEGSIRKAEDDRRRAEELLKEYEATIRNMEHEVAAMREKGREEAEAMRRDILVRAESEAKETADRALREIELARTQALEDIRTEAVTMGMAVASRVVGRSLETEDHRRLAHEVVQGLSGVGASGAA